MPNYQSFTALVIQFNQDAPQLSLQYENELGSIYYSRVSQGFYKIHGNFPINKTVVPPFSQSYGVNIPGYYNVPGDCFYRLSQNTTDEIQIEILDKDGNYVEWNNYFADILIEIRVYP